MRNPLILMAAGVSSRMKKVLETGVESIDPILIHEANTLPKCMLSVGPDKTRFIDYILWNAIQAGFEEIIVVLNPKDTVTEAHIQNEKLLRNYKSTVVIRFVLQQIPSDREKPWGTGDAVWQALAGIGLQDNDMFTVTNSDNLCSKSVFEGARNTLTHTLFPYSTDTLGLSADERSKYGIVVSDRTNGQVINIVEKPSLEELITIDETYNTSINMNIFSLKYGDTWEQFRDLTPHPVRQEKELTDVLSYLAKKGTLECSIIQENLPDLTSKGDIPKVQAFLSTNYPQFLGTL